ncbi:Potassium channel [Mortierella sp. AM989]|nr:Potassium channel [Mortierella sp. AM989]
MWNPPAPELQIGVNHHPSSSRSRHNGPRHNQINHANLPIKTDQNGEPSEGDNFHVNIGESNASNDHNNGNNNNKLHFITQATTTSRHIVKSALPHPKLEKVGPYITIATLQAYTVLTVVRCLADPAWIILKSDDSASTHGSSPTHLAEIGSLERVFLSCAIGCTMLSCLGVTLRILDKLPWLRRIPVITAYLEAIFCIAALVSFLSTHTPLPPGGQFSHGFLACIITAVFSAIVAIMLTVDWWRGFPSAGLSATLKALIISSFVMTIVIIIGAAIYTAIEKWTFDEAVNFCIVSFATIGYGNLSPKSTLGQVVFFFYGLLGISSLGFFVVSLRNAVIEQFQWRLVEKFSNPAHLSRVQTRMSAKDISFPVARFQEEQRVKTVVKRRMIVRMFFIWIVMWFGGAGVFCAFESWTFIESLYFCFVTLTTIGFGDYVPEQPGSIEFWNVYVFVGLSVFAYILSLSSESMAQHIHLVDDREDDDSMYGWERNEDPNAPLTTRSATLGLEGLKWYQNQQNIQQPKSNLDDPTNEEGKSTMASNNAISNLASENSMGHENSVQSSIQRARHRDRNPTGRVLMVSSRERKQMLQAEYYAAHSFPTTIRFMDTRGVPHQRTFHGGNITTDHSGADNVEDQATHEHGTVGYYGTIGRHDYRLKHAKSLRNHDLAGVGVGTNGTMYGTGSMHPLNTLQTSRLQHRPLIKFDSPTSSVRGANGCYRGNQTGQFEFEGLEEQNERVPGAIPSCLNLFSQGSRLNSGEKGSPRSINNRLSVERPLYMRLRSNSCDNQGPGPTQNEIHRWLAENAGTLEAPEFPHAYKEQELDAEFGISPRSSRIHDGTRIIGLSTDSAQFSQNFSTGFYSSDRQSLLQNENLMRPYEGVAPDEIPALLTTEPEPLNAMEEAQFHSDQSTVYVEKPSAPLAHETTLLNKQETASPTSSNNLFLGGGIAAGYGRHAYGVPMSGSGAESAANTQTEFMPVVQPASPTVVSCSSAMPAPEPTQLFDDDGHHQLTLHVSSSQPPSLFSNHPHSGQNSAVHSPSGSISSTKSPVLMTIFDVPVLDLPGSRTVSRNNSLSIRNQQSRSRASSNAQRRKSEKSNSSSSNSVLDGDGEAESSTQNQPPSSYTRVSSDVSIGAFDETRNPETIAQFDQNIDPNHIVPSSQQIEERQQQDMKRREKEIEARLARLGPKGRADYQP